MSQCPFCQNDSIDPGLRPDLCPRCGHALNWDATGELIGPAGAGAMAEIGPRIPEPTNSGDAARQQSVAAMRAALDAIARRGSGGTAADDDTRGYTVQWLGERVLGAADMAQGESPFRDSRAHLPALSPSAAEDLSEGNPVSGPHDQPVIQPDGKPVTLDDRRYAQTLDSGNVPAGGINPTGGDQPAEPGTVNDRRFANTLDSGPIGASDVDKLQNIWSGTHEPQSSPRMTIKGESRVSARDSKLVIRPHRVKEVREPATTGAEYELLGKIGEGGMGVVYAARQASIDRTVALKMLKPDAATNSDHRNKFLSEAVVTGDLDHPNIVPIYDLGANEQNALFYSMKRVQGTPWVAELKKKSQAENLEILMKVADAVGFAHSRGVVHRDLKPENVMLGEFGEVLVMDWGLALSTSEFRKSGSITQSTSMGGTPAYMAPEMATGPIDTVGPASDIYLLGAMLYEVITGNPPHTGKNVMNCLYAAARNEIVPTRHTGELVEIALRAMATSQAARHDSVRDFQDAIRQYRSHTESITLATRAETDLADAQKSGDYQTYSRAVFAFQEAIALWSGNTKAAGGLIEAKLAYARTAFKKEDFDLAASLLDARQPSHAALRREIAAAQAERNARQQRLKKVRNTAKILAAAIVLVICGFTIWINSERSTAIAAREDAKQAELQAKADRDKAKHAEGRATADRDKAMVAETQARDAQHQATADRDKAVVAETRAHEARDAEEYSAYVARIGLAAAKIDDNAFDSAKQLLDECKPELRNWEWGRLSFLCRQDQRDFDAHAPVDAVAYAGDGKRFATGGWDGKIRLWNIESGEQLAVFPYGGQMVHDLAFSPNDKLLAAVGNDKAGYVKIWNVADGRLVSTPQGHTDAVLSVKFSRDGRRLLTAGYDDTARLWNVADGRALRSFVGHSWWVWSAAFSPDEKQIVTGSQDGTAILWPIEEQTIASNKTLPTFTGHQGPVYAVAYSPDGTHVASAGYDKRVLVWNPAEVEPFDFNKLFEARAKTKCVALEGHTAAVRSLAFSRDGHRLLSGGNDNTLRLWSVESGQLIRTFRGHGQAVRSVAFAPDGEHVLSGSQDQHAKLWSVAGYEEVRALGGRVLAGHDDAVLAASFSRDGGQIVTASRDRTAKLWDFATGHELATFKEGHEYLASTAIFFPGEKKLLTSAIDDTTRIWDVAAGTQSLRLDNTGRNAAAALSADGKWILTGGSHKQAKLWNAETGQLAKTFEELAEVSAVAISPDNQLMYLGDASGHGLLRSLPSGEPAGRLEGHSGRIVAAAFLPGGRRLLTASTDNTVAQWDVAARQEMVSLVLKHPNAVTSLAVSADGRRALTSCVDKVVRLWDVPRAAEIGELDARGENVNTVGIAPDGLHGLTVGYASSSVASGSVARSVVRLWDLTTQGSLGEVKTAGGLVWSAVFTEDSANVLTVGGNSARLWDLKTGRERMSFSPNGAVASASLSADGKHVLTGSWDNSAKIWNVETGRDEQKLTGGHTRYVNTAVFSPDGNQALTASDDGTAKLWDLKTGEVIRSFAGHRDHVRAAIFSPDGKRVVTGSSDNTARIWDTVSGEMLHELGGHLRGVTSVAMAADGRVVTGSDDNTAKLWNGTTGAELLTLSGHTAGVSAVAISPDGQRVLTGSQDNSAKLWDSNTGKEILTLKGHVQEVTSVAFSFDGRYVVTSSRDGTALVWLTSPWKAAKPEPAPH